MGACVSLTASGVITTAGLHDSQVGDAKKETAERQAVVKISAISSSSTMMQHVDTTLARQCGIRCVVKKLS